MNKVFSLVLALAFVASPLFAGQNAFELVEGDRVVFVGGTFAEREQEENYVETMLTRAFPQRHITFRNLGWSGDTVHSFLNPNLEPRPKYVPTVFDYVAKLKPTVVFVSYGMMESFDGDTGLDSFIKDYNTVLDKLSASTKRIVIISPFHHEKLGGQWPAPEEHNRQLQKYVAAIKKIANDRGLTFVNLYDKLPTDGKKLLTNNGVHLTDYGYAKAAATIAKELGLKVSEKQFTRNDVLRESIKDKNKQWWYHYRPMNSEYVYPGGERYQVQIGPVNFPMYTEIEEFAKLAERGDKQIAALLKNDKAGKAIVAKDLTISRPMQRDTNSPDPSVERAAFKMGEGLNVDLFAADPLIDKPVQMAFDQRGRLWVATTTLYPHIKPGEKASDKIIILEDTDHDGRADKATVFANDLYIPTAILPAKDGCYVSDDTKIYFYHDKDADGRADEREVILSGFGTEDSHHKAHVFRWGPEGNLYFNISVFLHNTIETPHGIVNVAGHWLAGVLSYRTETGKLDVHLATSVAPNPWGHYWNKWGFDFHIDSSGQQGSSFILPTANRSSTAIAVTGGQGKLAGAEIISGRHFPDSWQGNLISSPFKENRVSRWKFSDDSSGFALAPLEPVIVSTDNSFRPVDELVGPDGALYILDWYNPLIGHMQYHFRDPGRDKTHGRIWRITAKGRSTVPVPKFAGSSTKDVLEYLKSPEDGTRAQARRVLAERGGKEVVPALETWVKSLHNEYPECDHYRMEALWTYENLGVAEPALLKELLQAKEPNARAAATATIRRWRDQLPDALDMLEQKVVDKNERVRLEAVISLSYFQNKRAVELALKVLDSTMDRYLDQALKNTVVALKAVWEPALASGNLAFGSSKHLDFVLQTAGKQAPPKALLALLKQNKISEENFDKTVATISEQGELSDLSELYRHGFAAPQQAKIFAALTRAARERKMALKPNPELSQRLKAYVEGTDEPLKAEALQLAGAWKVESLRGLLMQEAQNGSSAKTREAAMNGLSFFGDKESHDLLSKLSQGDAPKSVRAAALTAFANVDLVNAANHVVFVLCHEPETQEEITKLLNIIFAHKDGASHLASIIYVSVLPKSSFPKLNTDNAKLALQTLQLSGRSGGAYNELKTYFSDAAGLTTEGKELSYDELMEWVVEVQNKGDAARGERIFHRDELTCFKCHAVASAGGQVGPDLSAVGGGSTIDYLIESILNPNKIIKDGFETIEVTTKDDESYLGIRVREGKDELVLKDVAHPELVIPKNQIRERDNKKVSLMPSGLTAGLTRQEFIDLVRFLSELGKPGPYANNPKPLVRRWRLLNPQNSWVPAYSLVNGDLIPYVAPQRMASAARCDVEVTTPGKIALKLNATKGLRLTVDEKLVELKNNVLLDLGRGVHTFHFDIDASRKDVLHAEFEEVAGSPGRFQVVGGP